MLGTFTLSVVTSPEIPESISSGLPTRDSDALTVRIDQIEGDVDPATLRDWTADLGGFPGQFTQNTETFTVSLDTAVYDRWAHFGDLNGDTGWTIELNLRIDRVGDPGGDVGVFDVVSRTNRRSERSPWFYLRPDGIGVRPGALGTEPPLIAANLYDGRFHKIRMSTVAGEAHTIWIDGVLVGRWTENDLSPDPAVFLGRNGGNTVDDGITTIDYFWMLAGAVSQ